MQINPSIILSGQQPDFVNTLARSTQAAQLANQNRDQNALRQLFQTQGPQIMAGDGNALNALAQLDPNAALGIQGARQDMTIQRERIGLAREASAREAARYAMDLEEGQRTQFKEATRALVGMLSVAQTPEQFEQAKQRAAAQYPGFDMSQYTFDDLPMVVAELEGAAVGFDLIERRSPKPDYTTIDGQLVDKAASGGPAVVPIAGMAERGPEWVDLTPEELQRFGFSQGQRNAKTNKVEGKTLKTGEVIRISPDGTMELIRGGSKPDGEATVGDVYNPATATDAVELIDDILGSPSLDRVLGPIEGGGGNDIEDLGLARRMWYGAGGLDVIEKINQLQSKSWLAARDMLKGGGPITDYESRKAEAAVARLSRAKGEKEYRAALKDLRDAITEGVAKLEAAKAKPAEVGGSDSGPQYQFQNDEQRSVYEKYSSQGG